MTKLSPNLVIVTTVESSSVSARTKLSIFDRCLLSFLCLLFQQVNNFKWFNTRQWPQNKFVTVADNGLW
jgi:hypothetical protein